MDSKVLNRELDQNGQDLSSNELRTRLINLGVSYPENLKRSELVQLYNKASSMEAPEKVKSTGTQVIAKVLRQNNNIDNIEDHTTQLKEGKGRDFYDELVCMSKIFQVDKRPSFPNDHNEPKPMKLKRLLPNTLDLSKRSEGVVIKNLKLSNKPDRTLNDSRMVESEIVNILDEREISLNQTALERFNEDTISNHKAYVSDFLVPDRPKRLSHDLKQGNPNQFSILPNPFHTQIKNCSLKNSHKKAKSPRKNDLTLNDYHRIQDNRERLNSFFIIPQNNTLTGVQSKKSSNKDSVRSLRPNDLGRHNPSHYGYTTKNTDELRTGLFDFNKPKESYLKGYKSKYDISNEPDPEQTEHPIKNSTIKISDSKKSKQRENSNMAKESQNTNARDYKITINEGIPQGNGRTDNPQGGSNSSNEDNRINKSYTDEDAYNFLTSGTIRNTLLLGAGAVAFFMGIKYLMGAAANESIQIDPSDSILRDQSKIFSKLNKPIRNPSVENFILDGFERASDGLVTGLVRIFKKGIFTVVLEASSSIASNGFSWLYRNWAYLLAVAVLLYLVYRTIAYIRLRIIGNRIFEDLRYRLREISRNGSYDSGLTQDEIVNLYSLRFGFDDRSFRYTVWPYLEIRRQSDGKIREFHSNRNGKMEKIWQWN